MIERFASQQLPPDHDLEARILAIFHYAKKLSLDPGSMVEEDIQPMRAAGLDDGEILDVNQVTAYFAYANRVADGLGIKLEPFHQDSAPSTK